jgi:hypothetical protein
MRWSPEEDAAIREYYPFKAAHELASSVLPNHSPGSIVARAHYLGVKKAPGMAAAFTQRMGGVHHWTDEEMTALAKRYPDEYTKDIARDLGLSITQVSQKAYLMGLKKCDAFNAHELLVKKERASTHAAFKATRFQHGAIPWNKGKHFDAGGRSAETRFKKGGISLEHQPINPSRDCDGLLAEARSQ